MGLAERVVSKAWVLLGLKGDTDTQKRVQKAMAGMLKAFLSIAAARQLWAFFGDAVDRATKQMQINAEVQMSIANGLGYEGQQLEEVTASVLRYASAKQYQVGFYDEEISKVTAMMAIHAKSEEELIRMTDATIDYAVKSQQSLVTASQTIARAISTGQTRAIKAYVGELREGETVTEALERSVGGLAETMYAQGAARTQNLKKAIGDLTEGVGMGIINCGVFGDVVDEMSDQAENAGLSMAEKVANSIKNFIADVELFIASLISGIVKFIGNALNFVQTVINSIKLGFVSMTRWVLETIIKFYDNSIGKLPEKLRGAFGDISSLQDGLEKVQLLEEQILRTADEGGWGQGMLNWAEAYEAAAIETRMTRSMEVIRFSAAGNIPPVTENLNDLGGGAQDAADDVEELGETFVAAGEKILGTRFAEITTQVEKNLENSIRSMKEKLDGTAPGFEWNMDNIGSSAGQHLWEGILAAVDHGKFNFGQAIAAIIFEVIQQYVLSSLIPGGGFLGGLVGGLFRGIGSMFGFSAGGGEKTTVNIQALDALSFDGYLRSYNTRRTFLRGV